VHTDGNITVAFVQRLGCGKSQSIVKLQYFPCVKNVAVNYSRNIKRSNYETHLNGMPLSDDFS
jgi:hypothetical protein